MRMRITDGAAARHRANCACKSASSVNTIWPRSWAWVEDGPFIGGGKTYVSCMFSPEPRGMQTRHRGAEGPGQEEVSGSSDRRQDFVFQVTGSEGESLADVFVFELRVLALEFGAVRIGGECSEEVPHSQAQMADARLPVQLRGVTGDAVGVCHCLGLPFQILPRTGQNAKGPGNVVV
jgi:hypothetical protein